MLKSDWIAQVLTRFGGGLSARPWLALGLFSALGVALMWTVLSVTALHDRQRALDLASRETRRLTQTLEAHTRRTFESALFAMEVINSDLATGNHDDENHSDALLDGVLASLKTHTSAAMEARLVDSRGRILPLLAPPAAHGLDVSGQEHVRVHRDGPRRTLHIGAPQPLPGDGDWVIPLSMRAAPNAHGVEVITLNIRLRAFQDLYSRIAPHPNGAVALLRADGTLLARFPHRPDLLGQTFKTLRIYAVSPTEPLTLRTAQTLDGVDRIVSAEPVTALPLLVSAAIAADQALAVWWETTVLHTAMGAVATLCLGGFTLWICLLLRRRDADAREMQVARQLAEVARDASDTARAAAERANHAKNEFLAVVSHELRTPLNAVIGFSEVLIDDLTDSAASPLARECAVDIQQSGRHLLTLVNDILDLARIEAHGFQPRGDLVELRALAESVVQPEKGAFAARRIGIELDVATDLPVLRADARAIKQMLGSLLSNAAKFSGDGGVVTVSARCAPEGVYLVVADRGEGIPPESLERILRPFEQAVMTRNRHHGGLGLGLPLVKRLIEAHDGRLELVSEVGRGTIATLWFPPERVVTHRQDNGGTSRGDSRAA